MFDHLATVAAAKGPMLLHLAGVHSGYLFVPVGIVLVCMLVMVAILIRDAIRRARCPHNDVRLRRQVRHHQFYFADVCMRCGKSSGMHP